MWFVLVPVLIYLGVGVLAYLALIVQIIRESGLAYVIDVTDIIDIFRYEGVYEGVRQICSILFWMTVLTIILVFGLPALIGICCLIGVFERRRIAIKYQ